MSEVETDGGCGCVGCAVWLMAFLFFWALWIGLPTSSGTLNIDIIPPGIYLDKK